MNIGILLGEIFVAGIAQFRLACDQTVAVFKIMTILAGILTIDLVNIVLNHGGRIQSLCIRGNFSLGRYCGGIVLQGSRFRIRNTIKKKM